MNINEQLLDALKMVLDDPESLNGRPRTYQYVVESIAAAEQAQHRCQYCDGTGDVHSPTGEWLGACDCESFQQAQQAEPATHSPIALQSIPKRQRDFTAENIRDIAHECMRIGDNEQAAVVFAIADALRDGNLTIHPAAVVVPEGYALVPIEPTQAMLCAGQKEWLESAGADPSFDMYRAMLAAAQKGGA